MTGLRTLGNSLITDPEFRLIYGLENTTHHAGIVQLRSNLRVITGSAEYGAPCIQNTFELEELFYRFEFLKSGESGKARSGETDASGRQKGTPK